MCACSWEPRTLQHTQLWDLSQPGPICSASWRMQALPAQPVGSTWWLFPGMVLLAAARDRYWGRGRGEGQVLGGMVRVEVGETETCRKVSGEDAHMSLGREMEKGRQDRSGGPQLGLLAQGRQWRNRILPLFSLLCNGASHPVPTALPPPASCIPLPNAGLSSSFSPSHPRRFLCRSNLICCATAGTHLL